MPTDRPAAAAAATASGNEAVSLLRATQFRLGMWERRPFCEHQMPRITSCELCCLSTHNIFCKTSSCSGQFQNHTGNCKCRSLSTAINRMQHQLHAVVRRRVSRPTARSLRRCGFSAGTWRRHCCTPRRPCTRGGSVPAASRRPPATPTRVRKPRRRSAAAETVTRSLLDAPDLLTCSTADRLTSKRWLAGSLTM